MDRSLAFEQVTSGFYRTKDGDLAADAFRHLVDMTASPGWAEDESFANILFLFCRIAQSSEKARQAFEAMLPSLDQRAATLLRRILEAHDEPEFPDAMRVPITGPGDLDMMWAEFFVTGAPDPIVRIIATLDREDRVRTHLNAWLQERTFFGGLKRRAVAGMLESVGLVVDLASKTIVTAGDLDCLCYSIAQRQFPIFTRLPFKMSPEDILALATKGAALWSLRLNATQHEAVAVLCESERCRPGGAARLRLTEPLTEERPFAL